MGAIFWVYVLVERLSFWNVFFEIAIFSKKFFGMYFLGKHFLRCIFREQFFKNNIWNVFFEGENSLKEILKCVFLRKQFFEGANLEKILINALVSGWLKLVIVFTDLYC